MGVLLAKVLAMAVIVHGPCPGDAQVAACAVAPNTIYVSQPLPPGYFTHELGHLIDYNLLTNRDRGTFLALTHQKRWWLAPDPNSPHEKFAEAVRLCARSSRWLDRYTLGYGYNPTLREHRKVCRWLASLVG